MKTIIQIFGIFLLLAGIVLLVDPSIIFNLIEGNSESTWLYATAIGVRLILGSVLVIAAKSSNFPMVLKVLGIITLIAAFTFLFMGHQSFQELMASVLTYFKPYGRIASLASFAFGGFLIYAFMDRSKS